MERYHYDEQELKLIEESPIPCAVYQFVDKRVVTVAVSVGFCELVGIKTLEEAYYLMDNDMYRDTHPDDIAEIADAAVRFATEGGEYNVTYRSKEGDDYIILHAIGKHIYKPTGERLAVVYYTNEGRFTLGGSENLNYIYQLQSKMLKEKDIKKKVAFDSLTGLPEMKYFFELAEAEHINISNDNDVPAMVFLDMNGMKGFNQKYGFAEGDVLIKAFSKLLIKYFSNDNCSRFTADHFAVYTREKGLLDKLNALIEDTKTINEGRTLPIRIGIYLSKYEFIGASSACDRAKMACDTSKNIFESTITFFDKAMLQKYEQKQYVLNNIDRAIQDDWIKAYFQPIVRTANGKVSDEETLARWVDPIRGMISPADFVSILEDARIAYKLDLYMAEKALKKMKEQEKEGIYVVPVSVNLSRSDFYACDIVEEIRKRVDEAGIEREKLTIELTESIIVDDIDFMKEQIERFRNLGFKVWMDDFGSGYSSPDILQQIHFDVVKFDKLFVDKIDESEGSRIIITEMIKMANALGCETVAEGVESEKQVNFLKEIGCTKLQGYYYSKPIPMAEIIERTRTGNFVGYENPAESEYYEALGNVNLYDLSIASDDDDDGLHGYFDTMPMLIIEVDDERISLVRTNRSYREFMTEHYPDVYGKGTVKMASADSGIGEAFAEAIKQCKASGKRVILDERTKNGNVVHFFVRRISVNPVTGVVAMAVVILGYVNNDEQLRHKEELERIRQERRTYARITALSGDFICIYTIDPQTNHYTEYSATQNYEGLGIAKEGDDFFEEARKNGQKYVYVEDLDAYLNMFTKENIIEQIKEKGGFSMAYRLMIDGRPRHVTAKAVIIEEADGLQLIIGIVDVNEQVKRDEEYALKLSNARDKASLDALTGVKNKHAYVDIEARLNSMIEEGEDPAFAIVVFDLNGLKKINDTLGHQAGDEFIKKGCSIICKVFNHSPVFRVGGDEFVVVARGSDYENIGKLMKKFQRINRKNKELGDVVIAAGMARYKNERAVSSVFERADTSMYHNKQVLKEEI